MTDQNKKAGLSSYLGKYADQVFFDNQPLVETDEYSLNTYCRVKIRSDEGDTYQNVPLGPTEIYAFPEGDRKNPVLKGILDGEGYLIPCHKNEKGDFEIITEDQQIQIIPSAENVAKASNLSRTIVKTNMQNRQAVFQSEEIIKATDGKTFHESEAYTLTYMSEGKPVGPIEYYMQSPHGQRKAEFLGVLGMDGKLEPCTRNAEGNFETVDVSRPKQVIKSAENELKGSSKYFQVTRTDYFMGRPIRQNMVKENGTTYTLAAVRGDQPVAPTEYYILNPDGKADFIGILDANGQVFPCTRNSDGNFEIDNGDGQKQVVESMANVLKEENNKDCKIVQTNYALGKPVETKVLNNIHEADVPYVKAQSSVIRGPMGPKGDRGPMGDDSTEPKGLSKAGNISYYPPHGLKDKLLPRR